MWFVYVYTYKVLIIWFVCLFQNLLILLAVIISGTDPEINQGLCRAQVESFIH